MPDQSGVVTYEFSDLLRLAGKTADGSVLFHDCVPGRNDMAGYEPPAGIGRRIAGAMHSSTSSRSTKW